MKPRFTNTLPLRARLALVSAVVFALTLAAVGSFLYFQTKHTLDDAIDGSLQTRARTLAALADRGGDLGRADDFFQLLGPGNSLITASPRRARSSLLTRAEFASAARRRIFIRHGEESRLLAVPAGSTRGAVIVVGSSLHQREHALEGLVRSLLIGGPLALLIAGAAGYWLATRALQPVERMRRRAETISRLGTDQRLPLPVPRDEIRRLGETLNAMLSRLDEATEHERRFVADASHELRTPLSRLRSELELARADQEVPVLHEAIDSALEETVRLCTLADDLLSLASMDDPASAVPAVTVDLSELASTCVREHTPRLPAGRVVEAEIEPALLVEGDPLRLRQAIENLLQNAVQHGGGKIRLSLEAEGSDVVVRVSDEGTGFDPEYLDTAFDRFSRPTISRQSTGSGLGLAIARAIVRSHGGQAQAGNAPGGGASVILTLPRKQSALLPLPKEAEQRV